MLTDNAFEMIIVDWANGEPSNGGGVENLTELRIENEELKINDVDHNLRHGALCEFSLDDNLSKVAPWLKGHNVRDFAHDQSSDNNAPSLNIVQAKLVLKTYENVTIEECDGM